MPKFSFDDLIKPFTREEAEESLYDVLGIVGTRVTAWMPGAVVRTMVSGQALLLSAFSELLAKIARMGFLELAEGTWLELIAWYVYGVKKEHPDFAPGVVTVDNTAGGNFDFDPGDVVFRHSVTKKTYVNLAAFSVSPLEEGVQVAIRAVEVGSGSNAIPGAITEFETNLQDLVVTNEQPVIGSDGWTDPQVRAACYEKLGSLSPFGPRDAFVNAAKKARRPDGSKVGVTRVRTVRDGNGGIRVICATDTGGVSGSVEDDETDLYHVNEALWRDAASLNDEPEAESAVPHPLAIVYEAWALDTSALTSEEFQAQIAIRLAEFMKAQPIGGHVVNGEPGKVFRDAIRAAISNTRPEVFTGIVTSPADDEVLNLEEVPTLLSVTCTALHFQEGGATS